MKSTFDRQDVIKQLAAIANNQGGQVSNKDHSVVRQVSRTSNGLFIYTNRPDMAPKSIGAMADLICASAQSCN